MPPFNKKLINRYKTRLQEKLKTITLETENATSFLNNYLEEFNSRVAHILEIKDEKCLSLYRKLIRDLENFSEKLFVFHATFEDVSDESDSKPDEDSATNSQVDQSNPVTSLSSLHNVASLPSVSCAETEINISKEDNCDDGGSVTEDDFCSLHSDSNTQNILSDAFSINSQTDQCYRPVLQNSPDQPINQNFESTRSFSLSSCYRSVSSNISESLVTCSESKQTHFSEPYPAEINYQNSSESKESVFLIHPPIIKVPSNFSTTLSHIVDPGDFWIQIENSLSSSLSFPKTEYAHLSCPSSMKEGEFCLAPFKSTCFYYRAQSLSCAKSEKDLVKVHFIDHGSTQHVLLCDLRFLPASASEICTQAIHCYLYGITSIDGSWSEECISTFKDFQDYCIEARVKSEDSLYAVQLIAKVSEDLNEDFSIDIALSLCLDGFAISTDKELQNISTNQRYEDEPPQTVCKKYDSSLEVSAFYDINAISSDSGVSVNSAYKSSQTSKSHDFNKIVQEHLTATPLSFIPSTNYCDKKFGFNYESQLNDHISFESNNALKLKNSNNVFKFTASGSTSDCKKNNFCLQLKIPPPSLMFVEKDMLIVMLSHIISPYEFYVNMAMENIVTLDELREHMTSVYESQRSSLQRIKIEELTENMFCAAHYDVDNYWYRVKILRINLEDRRSDHVLVQYVDYGNTATVKCSDLQPLTPEFSKHPTFAIRCSLAGVTPLNEQASNKNSLYWDKHAVKTFEKLANFDRCLTAQICNNLSNDNKDTFSVLLWDTEESEDFLINAAMVDCGVAKCNNSLLKTIPFKDKVEKTHNDNDMLNHWDPMSEEYNDIENSYAVDDEDIQIATGGYQARDEEYTCKYFSLRGYCPRGESCPYEHLSLLESGITRDQEEVYCLDTVVPLIPENVSNTLVQVSAIINPGHFYAVLPFGCKTVDEIDTLVNRGLSYAEIVNNEARGLFHALNKHYANAPFQENTTIALSCGTIVAAKRKWDKLWHRGRIIDVSDISGPAKVFFVDSGDGEWVPRKFIRTILPQFLHTPFQAIQCSLHGLEPTDTRWSSDAVSYFKDNVEGEVLLAEVIQRFGEIFHVTLTKTSRNNHQSINQLLVSQGFAFFRAVVHTEKKKQSIYVPG